MEARPEAEVFADLAQLCRSPGYIHALAFFSFRDNLIRFNETLDAEAMESQHAPERLVRTEISTLMGLMVHVPVDYSLPTPDVLQGYIDRSQLLLAEMHHAMSASWFKSFQQIDGELTVTDPFSLGENLREPIFYSGESAYGFQYEALAVEKYYADEPWLLANKGFTAHDAVAAAKAIAAFLTDQQAERARTMLQLPPDEWTMLPASVFHLQDISARCSVPPDRIAAVLDAFSLPQDDRNATFIALNDFNVTNAMPILRREDGSFILIQTYSLLEAVYESPFFWMMADKPYIPKAQEHRGAFTEDFTATALRRVFGPARVYRNIDVYRPNGDRLSEIDVLVVYGNRALVVQAKSKRLTMEARKGNDQQLRNDFKKAVQDAADQAYLCAAALLDDSYRLVDADGNPVVVPRSYSAILPMCVVCDHYPALAFQADHFLTKQSTDIIAPPLTTDVFAIDVMAEMLASPLHFLHYLTLRAQFGEKFKVSHELTLLGYHLARNLWGENEFTMMMLSDDIAMHVDIAMLVRRQGIPGDATPEGILTRFKGTTFGHLFAQIEGSEALELVDLGLLLLQLNEETALALGQGIEKLASWSRQDRKVHDLSIPLRDAKSGLTIHCRYEVSEDATERLMAHCQIRKHISKADSWFGLLVEPDGHHITLSVASHAPWEPDPQLDEAAKHFSQKEPTAWRDMPKQLPRKVGRNDPCSCGSGKKYKKCCL